jgi:hypothetical protein
VWVEGGDIRDELLDQLGGVLAPPEDLALTPSAAEFEALAAAVAAQWPNGAFAPAAADTADAPGVSPEPPKSPIRPFRSGGRHQLRRLGSGAWRAGSVAAGLVLASASAAAAANGGVPLPRPVRMVAYNVGLPVDSPALDDTNQHIKELKQAVKSQDKPKAEATVRRLRTDLAKVPADEKPKAVPKVEAAIAGAINSGAVQSSAPTTTTTVSPSSTTPASTAPTLSTTATTAEEKEKEKEKPAATTTTTEATTKTTEPESTTTTTAPETDENPSGDPGTGTGDGGSIGTDPGPTTTTTSPPDTTTTTTAPPDETTTTTSSTTTTTAPPAPATVEPE